MHDIREGAGQANWHKNSRSDSRLLCLLFADCIEQEGVEQCTKEILASIGREAAKEEERERLLCALCERVRNRRRFNKIVCVCASPGAASRI